MIDGRSNSKSTTFRIVLTCSHSSQTTTSTVVIDQHKEYSIMPSSKRKSVQFRDYKTVYFVSSHRKYSDDEYFASWYQTEELKEMQDDCFIDVILLRRVPNFNVNEDENYCPRGLEKDWTNDGCKQLTAQRERARNAVLEAQERFRDCENMDIRIQVVSLEETADLKNRAFLKATRDATYVRQCVREEKIAFMKSMLTNKPNISPERLTLSSTASGERLRHNPMHRPLAA